MKKYRLALILLVPLIITPLMHTSLAAAQENQVAEKGLFYPSRLQTRSGTITHPTQFTSARVCAGCHPDIFYQWDGSMHSRAHDDPLYMNLSMMASSETEGLTDRFCAGCHSPIAVASEEVPPVGNPEMSRIGAEGVTCDFCHTIDSSTGTGNLPAVLDPGTNKRGPRKDARSPFHPTSFLELSTQAEFCGLCHDVSHPLNDLPIEQTYTEWKNGPYNSDNPSDRVYCQDCHMRQRPGFPSTGMTKRTDYRAKAATMGPWRDNVYTHYFVGGNTGMTAFFGSMTHQRMAQERLKAAASIDIINPAVSGGTLDFEIRITNSGAGHYLPTGLTELREMWIETSIVTADGQVLFSSGTLDEGGAIDHEAPVYHTVLGDAEGRPTMKVWEATRILSDRRIPPLEHDEVHYSVKTTRKWGDEVLIRSKLLYRSYSPAAALFILGPGSDGASPVEMTRAEKQIKLD